MNDLVPIFIMGFLTYGTYAIIELFVRRKERLAIIEKLTSGSLSSDSKIKIDLFLEEKRTGWGLRVGCLLLGVGLGLFIVSLIELNVNISNLYLNSPERNAIAIMYGAAVLLFGGLGLVTSYFVERKLNKLDKKTESKTE